MNAFQGKKFEKKIMVVRSYKQLSLGTSQSALWKSQSGELRYAQEDR